MAGLFLILSLGVVLLLSQCCRCQYILIQNNKTWDEAEAFCRKKHLHLATVHNHTDWKILRENLYANNFTSDVWMGLYNDINSWRWSFQNENITFTSWNAEEPNNRWGIEECGSLKSGQNGWNDVSCSTRLPFVCYDGRTNSSIFRNTLSNWHEAQTYCRQQYTDLATVRNGNDHNTLIGLTSQTYEVWIGLFRDSWKWVNGMPASWIMNHPDNSAGNESCGYVNSTGHVGDSSCSVLRPFVCSAVVKRKQIVRLEIKAFRNIENDPQIQSLILQQIQQKLLQLGMAENTNITWKVQADGQVFHKRED